MLFDSHKMKFKQTWQRELTGLPCCLRDKCIDYKQWKKVTVCPEELLKEQLQLELNKVETVFMGRKKKACCCFSYVAPKVEDHMMYKYAILNRTCMNKLVKRCDKRFGTQLRKWYISIKDNYTFCGSAHLTRLELALFGYTDSCPLCLECPSTSIILDCGHIVCLECFKDLYQIRNKCGTLQNLVLYANVINVPSPRCPMCRKDRPLKLLTENHIYDPKKSRCEIKELIHSVKSPDS